MTTRNGSGSRVLGAVLSFVVGVVGATMGIVPWLLTGAELPMQNLQIEAWPPEPWYRALLPVSQYGAVSICAMLVSGGGVAAGGAQLLRGLLGAARWPAGVGLLVAHSVMVAQSFTVVARVLGLETDFVDARADLYFMGMLAGTILCVLLAQVSFWLLSRVAWGRVSLGVGLAAAPFAAWLALWRQIPVNPGPGESWPLVVVPDLTSILGWVPIIVVGLALGWGGFRPRRRIAAWPLALALLWVMPPLLNAAGYVLSYRAILGDLVEMQSVFIRAVAAELPGQLLGVVLAAALALVVLLIRSLQSRVGGAPAENLQGDI